MTKRYLRIHYDKYNKIYIFKNGKKIYVNDKNKKEIRDKIKYKIYIKKKHKKHKIKKNKIIDIMDKLVDFLIFKKKRNVRVKKKDKQIISQNETKSEISGVSLKNNMDNLILKQSELEDILLKNNLTVKDNKIIKQKGLPAIENKRPFQGLEYIGNDKNNENLIFKTLDNDIILFKKGNTDIEIEFQKQIEDVTYELSNLQNKYDNKIQKFEIFKKKKKEEINQLENEITEHDNKLKFQFEKILVQDDLIKNKDQELKNKLSLLKKVLDSKKNEIKKISNDMEAHKLDLNLNLLKNKLQYNVFNSLASKQSPDLLNDLLKKSGFDYKINGLIVKNNLSNYIKNINKEAIIKNIKYDNLINNYKEIFNSSGYSVNNIKNVLNKKTNTMKLVDKNIIKKSDYDNIIKLYNELTILKNDKKNITDKNIKLNELFNNQKKELEDIYEKNVEFKELIKDINIEEDIEEDIEEEKEIINQGYGNNNNDGLSIDEINQVMLKYNKYIGTYTSDQIDNLIKDIKQKNMKIFGAIILVLNSNKFGHFISIYGDLKNEYVIECYDSLAILNNNPPKKYKNIIDNIYNKFQKLINDMDIKYLCK